MSFIPKAPMNPEYYNLVMPGITSKSRAAVNKLLKSNHESFHVFFNDKKFHNHLTHHLLAAYSFGANEERLEQIYKDHASYQRPLPPLLERPLTRENYQVQLGKASAYTSFLKLFETEIEQHGIFDTIRRWVWSGDMLSRLVGGVYHPLIHVGYGVEFGIAGQVAEGLAMVACTDLRYSPWINDNPPLSDSIPNVPSISTIPVQRPESKENDKNVLLDILQDIRQDAFFENTICKEDENPISKLFSQPRVVDKINDYAKQWKHDKQWTTKQDIDSRVKELYTSVVVAYGATGLSSNNQVRLDFFLMHALTSSYFIHILVPYLTIQEAASLVQAHWFATLTHYVAVGRPEVRMDRLLDYVSPNFKDLDPQLPHRQWSCVLDATVNEEEHVTKAIRACAHAQDLYNDDPLWFDDNVYLKVAQMTFDLHGNWTFGVGFDH
ncbi:uncharacterized protein BX664DRAFT_353676 [Halteromyces radiatus]|uniref:uncharacterized protein n=1 Tax=Halteromyces radiatus TaxID=101107 RepID=UPI00221F4E61|nr:uncharacterized protein BX664DRAFT_353676 [Halteromyces radiatus]KAI8077844.1 hypothetical protein BX664DRAFT_353676 [Halteromyces radiatus]